MLYYDVTLLYQLLLLRATRLCNAALFQWNNKNKTSLQKNSSIYIRYIE